MLTEHWTFDPVLSGIVVVALVHARGVRRLNRSTSAARRTRRRREAVFFDLGLLVLALAIASPIDYYADEYLFVHMVQHLLLLFAAPAAVVAGAPWIPLEKGMSVRVRRSAGRFLVLSPWARPLRGLGRFGRSPWVAVIGLNVAVVFWHLPAPLDLAEENQVVHDLLMHGSFFVFGVLLFLHLINSRPFRVTMSPQAQMVAIFTTAIVFWVFAMALGLFSRGAVYPWYRAHEGPLLTPYADQQIAAGIMWVCGDFWAIPAMTRAVRRLMEERRARDLTGSVGGGSLAGFNKVGAAHARAKMLDALREEPLREGAEIAAGRGADGGGVL
jgi:cytochrome c oxidase assembly factor CtaG